MVYRPWKITPVDEEAVRRLQAALGLPALLCRVLAARGCRDAAQAERQLGPGAPLGDPMAMHGMREAAGRILRAVDEGERIVVYGDYDVDGVTATALLYTYLDAVGAQVYYKLPNREADGYGLSVRAVEALAEKGVQLVITVDNGIAAAPAVRRAKELGMDVVVTDHHLPPDELPEAAAVVDPRLDAPDSAAQGLCGAGVAFKLICAMEGAAGEDLLPFYGDLAAIGTVADVVPLTGENRAIVKAGLALLEHSDRPGLAALIEAAGLAGRPVTAENVAFGIAPRMNAAGRMDDATAALRLLLCEDEEEAARLAAGLCAQNAARQQTERDILDEAVRAIEADSSYARDRILVVWGEGWHPGVIGIVAARLCERFGKPAIVVSEGEGGLCKGSGRSGGILHLYDALAAAAPVLEGFGGHAAAAGLTVRRENLPALRRALNEWAAREYPLLQRAPLCADAEIRLADIRVDEVAALDALEPFGEGCPAPLFAVRGAVLEGAYPMGEGGRHTRVRLRQDGAGLYAALFGMTPAQLCYAPGEKVDVILSLSVYEGKGAPSVSARVCDMRPAGMGEEHAHLAAQVEALLCGVPPREERQRAALWPQREDVAAVYRLLAKRAAGLPAGDLRPLFCRLGEAAAGRTLTALAALEQLGLVEHVQDEHGAPVLRAVKSAQKKDLAGAPVLRALKEG